MSPILTTRMTNFRWVVCLMLFFATTINYMDRQVLTLTWRDFIAPEFAWDDKIYGNITASFSVVYALSMLVVGGLIDRMGVKKGYFWAMLVWTIGALSHAFCGLVTCGVLTGEWGINFDIPKELLRDYGVSGLAITTISVWFFIGCQSIMAIGQAGNFTSAIPAIAQSFPKKDRTYVIAIFNTGSSVGALLSPLIIPFIAGRLGWEMAFIIIGGVGYFWMLAWILIFIPIEINPHVNMAEYNYIMQDEQIAMSPDDDGELERRMKLDDSKPLSVLQCLRRKRVLALLLARFLTDGAWWFLLFWTPVYISEFYGYSTDSTMGMTMIFLLYSLTLLAIIGGYLPTYFINKFGLTPLKASLRTMLIMAIIEVASLAVMPMGNLSPWFFVATIGLLGAAHQSWSANVYALAYEAAPKNTIGTVTGMAGFAGGMGSYIVMMVTGTLLTYAETADEMFYFGGYTEKRAVYMMLFSIFSVTYLLAWGIVRLVLKDERDK